MEEDRSSRFVFVVNVDLVHAHKSGPYGFKAAAEYDEIVLLSGANILWYALGSVCQIVISDIRPAFQRWETTASHFHYVFKRRHRKHSRLLEKPHLFGNLISQVIRQDSCSFCGACMAACPINILWPVDEQPTMVGTCALCEICYYQCPNVEFSSNDVETFLYGRIRRPDEPIGIYRQALVGRALNPEIKNRAQDGGVVTALLAYALENKVIDAAVVAGRDEKWVARPKVATKYDDLVQNAGTKYTPSPTLLGVRSAIDEYGKSKVGLVGTPCQIRAVRRIQTSPMGNRRLAHAMTLSIGLFCMESYKYEALIENYLISKGADPSKLTKVGIKKGQFIATSGESEVLRVPLKEIKQYVRGSCHRCDDFTAEYADISVGGVGCPEGHSTVIARTQTGLDLLMAASRAGFVELRELEQEDKGFQTVLRMAGIKKTKKTA